MKLKRPASKRHPKVPGWGNVIDQVSAGNARFNLVDFGNRKYGYIDSHLLLHYLPWEYESPKAAKMALIGYARAGRAMHEWLIHCDEKLSSLDFTE